MSNDILLILCDLGNVLLNFDYRLAVDKLQPYTNKDPSLFYHLFFDSPCTQEYEAGKISSFEFYQEVMKILEINDLSFEAFVPIWNNIFFENTGMLELLGQLKAQCRLHLISNTNELHFQFITQSFPDHLKVFDKFYLSYEVGCSKPNPEIYRRAIEEEGFSFSQALYIDDRKDLIEAAQNLKINSILFEGVNCLKKRLIDAGVGVE